MVQIKAEDIYERWATSEQFYQERDNRTMLEVENLNRYSRRPVEIWVDPGQAHTYLVQQMALLTCNLTARWARVIRVIVPQVRLDQRLARGGYTNLEQRILAEMCSADPFGDFRVVDRTINPTSSLCELPLRLFVGPWSSNAGVTMTADDYVAYARSWVALGQRGVAFNEPALGGATPAAAGLAAALGVADLFKRAIGHPREYWIPDFAWCTWSHSLIDPGRCQDEDFLLPVPDRMDLGRTLLAGVGAIGSALVYLMDFMPMRGHLSLLDRDRIELSNLNRSPLFCAAHVLADAEKTLAARDFLARQEVDVEAITGAWREHAPRLAQSPYDVWISFTNEEGAWAEVPFQLPPIVLHGTTTSGWGLGAGRHIPRREDCTLCRMPRPTAEFRGPCAEGEIELVAAEAPVRASLPFLSTASAALVLAEMLKLGAPTLPALPNDVSADLRFGLPAVVALTRINNSACRGCRASRSLLWHTRGGRGRYRSYSEAA